MKEVARKKKKTKASKRVKGKSLIYITHAFQNRNSENNKEGIYDANSGFSHAH